MYYWYFHKFLDPGSTEGPIKSPLSVCLSVCLSTCPSIRPSVRPSVHPSVCQFGIFLRNDSLFFSGFLARWLIIWIWKLTALFSRRIYFCPNLGNKGPKWPPKWGSFLIFEKWQTAFLGNNLKWKLILLLIFHHQSYIWQNSGC